MVNSAVAFPATAAPVADDGKLIHKDEVITALLEPLDPELALAAAYASGRLRARLMLLWRLDAALARIARAGREPALAELRLAWWRDALAALDAAPAPAEPLLRALAAELLPAGVPGGALAAIATAWMAAPHAAGDDEALRHHAADRGAALFGAAARLLDGGAERRARAAGAGWALVDAARRLPPGNRAAMLLAQAALVLDAGRESRWPVALRPLGMLAILARADARCAPGALPRQGSPRRIARMLAHRLTGR